MQLPLKKEEFLKICAWKTPRSQTWCDQNEENVIKEVSSIAYETNSELVRIYTWTALKGVQWPTASVFLHFLFIDKYPILDFRALWSLGETAPHEYSFLLWLKYVEACRDIAQKSKVTMRELDQALWKYSQINQDN